MSGSVDPDAPDAAEAVTVPVAAPPAAFGGGTGGPIAPVAVTGGALSDDNDQRDAPEREARNSGEDELGGSDGPAGGTKRP
jgi:hypothetical protein